MRSHLSSSPAPPPVAYMRNSLVGEVVLIWNQRTMALHLMSLRPCVSQWN